MDSMTVKQKQWQLYLLGYYPEKPDGVWGKKSVKATKDFQQAYSLTVDGFFGKETGQMSCDLIRKLQQSITDGKMAIDGLAGSETKEYIEQWQTKHGFTANGIADKPTLELILSVETDKQPTEAVDPWANIKYFSRREFACKCSKYCNGFPVEPNMLLIEQADIVREHFGTPMFVSSGVRCDQHNAKQKGSVPNSRHKSGKAMDFRVEGKSANTVLKYVKTLPNIRYAYAIDGSYVHMDVE